MVREPLLIRHIIMVTIEDPLGGSIYINIYYYIIYIIIYYIFFFIIHTITIR